MSTRLADWAAKERRARPLLLTARHTALESRWEPALLGVLGFAVSLALSAYLTLHLGIVLGDAISRVANAYYVLFSRDPHLGAIGFVWNPLPSLLEMPLVALHSLWPPLVSEGFAGNVVSSAFAGVAVYFFHRILARLGLSRPWRIPIALAFLANPMILFYGANGMTEMMMVGALLGAVHGVLAHLESRRLGSLASGAIWLAVAFLIRYEAVPFALLLGLGMAWGLAQERRQRPEVEGSLVLLATPIAYTMTWWMYVNWLIMKNPLYFVTSSYGNASQAAVGSFGASGLAAATHSVLLSAAYAAHFTLLFWPVLVGLAIVLLSLWGPWRDSRAPALLGALVAIPLLQVVLLYLGKSSGMNRFFIMYIPLGFLLVVFGVGRLRPRLRWLGALAALVLFVFADFGTLAAIQRPPLGNVDPAYVTAALHDRPVHPFAEYDAMARFFDRHPHLVVLADTFLMFPLVLRAHDPRQFVVSSDYDFHSILHYPAGRVDGFLVPYPSSLGRLDAVNRAWPGMWQGRVSWAKADPSFPGGGAVQLFLLTPQAP